MIKKEATIMARTNTYTCRTCGTKYQFCLRCQVARPDFDAESFCCKKHGEIYATLAKHGCNLINANDALNELALLKIEEINLTEEIADHIARIKSEASEAKTQVPAETEAPANKKHKKKW